MCVPRHRRVPRSLYTLPPPSRHQNRSIATLAITTLLKTGSESSVEKLLKQVEGG